MSTPASKDMTTDASCSDTPQAAPEQLCEPPSTPINVSCSSYKQRIFEWWSVRRSGGGSWRQNLALSWGLNFAQMSGWGPVICAVPWSSVMARTANRLLILMATSAVGHTMLNLPSSIGEPKIDSLKHFRKRSSKSLPSDELANSALATFRPRSRKARLIARWPKQSANEPRRTPGVDGMNTTPSAILSRSCLCRMSSHSSRTDVAAASSPLSISVTKPRNDDAKVTLAWRFDPFVLVSLNVLS
mmetsp:Transcript_6017/g.17965  ORF Transcript_6017/g.17965 Transcript_6017/m.17965 type:complete len:244 (+) Transcript_6017:1727-2458(+)